MATLFGMFPFLKTLFVDSGYQGPKFAKALAKVLPHLDIEIVKRSDQVSGFVACQNAAQSLPKARQGLGESQPKGARVRAPRLNPPHAQKTMQSSLKSPDSHAVAFEDFLATFAQLRPILLQTLLNRKVITQLLPAKPLRIS
jgi:hypothetical protein